MSACPETWDLVSLAWGPAGKSGQLLHVLRCALCNTQYQEMLEDRASVSGMPPLAPPETAYLRAGVAIAVSGFPLRKKAPVFRAGGVPVLHSAIHPFGRDYVLLELSGWDGDLELHLERGTKNGPDIPISLYMDEELSDQRTLQSRLCYRLTQLAEGTYRLNMRHQTVFRFNVQE